MQRFYILQYRFLFVVMLLKKLDSPDLPFLYFFCFLFYLWVLFPLSFSLKGGTIGFTGLKKRHKAYTFIMAGAKDK